MFSHDGKMICSVTGTTIDPKGLESYYLYTDKDGKEHHLCALAYALSEPLGAVSGFPFFSMRMVVAMRAVLEEVLKDIVVSQNVMKLYHHKSILIDM